ncbi:MAG TPA: hypothetical protein VIH42_08185 [Thermoguttaceae bacterium]
MIAFIRHFFWLLMANLSFAIRSKNLLFRAVAGMQNAVVDIHRQSPHTDLSQLIYAVQDLKDIAKDLE